MNRYRVLFNCIAVNVAMNAKSVCVFTPSHDAFFSWFAAVALARVKIKQKRAIHKAVIKEDLQTARKLLDAVMQGTYLVLPDLLPPNYCMVLNVLRSTI